jgi:uncharacterized protein (DUF1810 family)
MEPQVPSDIDQSPTGRASGGCESIRRGGSVDRFHTAQASPTAGYDNALAEIRRGRKTSHWIWYIFPQIEGLGRSSTARAYAIRDLAEACEYLRDPMLRARYEEIAGAVSEQLAAGRGLEDLMGGRTDALKLVSASPSSAPPPSVSLLMTQRSTLSPNAAIPSSNKPARKTTRRVPRPLPG